MKKTIGVFPRSEFMVRERLFKALEQIFYVNFVGCDTGEREDFDGGIIFDNQEDWRDRTINMPAIIFTDSRLSLDKGSVSLIDFGRNSHIDKCLQGRSLTECGGALFKKISINDGDIILAACCGQPVWILSPSANSTTYVIAAPIGEVLEGEQLRAQLVKGKFLALVALVHFIREITGNSGWQEPPLRANIMIDDPNFHASSYGYFHFYKVAKIIEKNKCCISIATVPVDGWLARKYFFKFLKGKNAYFSILMHGNDHLKREFRECLSIKGGERMLAQALRRIERLEKKIGFHIERIQIPPHETYSKESIIAMLHLKYEGLYSARLPLKDCIPEEMLLADWYCAELTYGCFPVISRRYINNVLRSITEEEDMIFNIFLRKPIVLCFHQRDLKSGLNILSQAADLTNSFGPVKWLSAEGILRSNYAIRYEDRRLHIRMYSRKVFLTIPQGVKEVIVEAPFFYGDAVAQILSYNGKGYAFKPSLSQRIYISNPIPVESKEGEVDISMIYPISVDIDPALPARWQLWPITRRLLAEIRDRLMPIINLPFR
ncbi:MAG: hypothetical protein PHQ96_07495 [Candidatus Omnitrophica bacterium]|nr:hypothetical protein [Candidatus Omnitrophota bacterium]